MIVYKPEQAIQATFMNKLIICLVGMSVLLGSCLKKDTGCGLTDKNVVAPMDEQQDIVDYLNSNSITATKHPSGLYYNITAAGAAGSPTLCSKILIKYTGTFTNGNVFDYSDQYNKDGVVFTLGGLIEGWIKGIPLIGKGGRIKLYIPPTLGYGSQDVKDPGTGAVVIPGNSMLIFDIELLDFN